MYLERKGVTRLVFIFKDFVVKIPNFTCQWNHFLSGLIGNMEEFKTWKYNKSELLCPILWASWGGWILIMKRVEVCTYEDEIDYTPWVTAGFGGDDKPDNYGYLDNKLVKIDYN